MPLKDIDQDLQQKDSKIVDRAHNKTVYNVWQSKEAKIDEKDWQKSEDTMIDTKVKSLTIGGIVVAILICIVIGMFTFMHFQKGFFAQDRVTLDMKSPQIVDSNELVEIEFLYKNDNRAYLNNAQILVEFGDYFEPAGTQSNFTRASERQGVITIGKIKGEEQGTATLAGYFVGPVGAVDDVSGILRYMPQKMDIRYEANSRSATTIASSPISLNISAPSEVVSGNLVDIVIAIKNSSHNKLDDLKLMLNVPAGFSIVESQPVSTNANTWLISEVESKSEVVITVRGAMDFSVGDVQTFRVNVGTQTSGSEYIEYAKGKYSPRIVKSPIQISHEVVSDKKGVTHVGEMMQYEIEFVNNGDVPLRDAIVTVKFDTRALDFSKLQLNGVGNFDEQKQIITWKATDVPSLKSLKPRDSDTIKFSVPIFDKLPIKSKDDYNFDVKTISSISSDDIPVKLEENKIIFGNTLNIPVESKVNLYSELKYKRGSKQLSVGEKTVYSVHLSIYNTNNDLGDTVVSIPLPTHVQFESGDDVIFNDRSNELLWKIGNIEHGAGITSDQIKTVFDVNIIPSVDQIGKTPIILRKQILTTKDKFTNTKINVEAEKVVTSDEKRGATINTVQE